MSAKQISTDQLSPGCLLLYRPKRPNCIQRKIIQDSRSPYTHAAIYLGAGKILDARLTGTGIRSLTKSVSASKYVAVMKTQLGFDKRRVDKLNEFARSTAKFPAIYNLKGALGYLDTHQKYFKHQMEILHNDTLGELSDAAIAKRYYFCSALVVAAYVHVGIIHPSAIIAYPENVFAPGDLYKDPTFGWYLGHLLPCKINELEDDELVRMTTHAADVAEASQPASLRT